MPGRHLRLARPGVKETELASANRELQLLPLTRENIPLAFSRLNASALPPFPTPGLFVLE